jgi:hypothetical protein
MTEPVMRKRDEQHRRAMQEQRLQQYGGIDPTFPLWAPGQESTRRSARSGVMDPADRATFAYTDSTHMPPGVHPPPPLEETTNTLQVGNNRAHTGHCQLSSAS